MRRPDIIIASTTSKILVDDLSGLSRIPSGFSTRNWLNPAYLIHRCGRDLTGSGETDPGRHPSRVKTCSRASASAVVCAATTGSSVAADPGLAMNEAARMVEEGASPVQGLSTKRSRTASASVTLW